MPDVRLLMKTLASFLVLGLLSACASSPPRATEHVLLRASRTVHCGAGWELTILPSGKAEQHVSDTCLHPRSYSRDLHLTPPQLLALDHAITSSSFFNLPAGIAPSTIVTDEDLLSITVWHSGRGRTVTARGLERMSGTEEAALFQLLWSQLVTCVPEPTQ